MKKNKFIITAVIFCCVLFMSSAATPKTFTTRDDVYKRVDNLCRIAGVTSPSSFSPMTGRSLEIALDRIDRTKLTAKETKELDELYIMISGDDTHLYSEKFFKLDLGLKPMYRSMLQTIRISISVLQKQKTGETNKPFLIDTKMLQYPYIQNYILEIISSWKLIFP